MKAALVHENVFYIGEVVSASFVARDRQINVAKLKFVEVASRDLATIVMLDGVYFNLDGPGNRHHLKGQVTLRIESLDQDISFDLHKLSKFYYPVDDNGRHLIFVPDKSQSDA